MRGHLNTDVRARGSNSQPLDPEFDTLDRSATDPQDWIVVVGILLYMASLTNCAGIYLLDYFLEGPWLRSWFYYTKLPCELYGTLWRVQLTREIYIIEPGYIQVEHGSFSPLVFNVNGGMGNECRAFYSRLSDLLALKRHLSKSLVSSWLKTKINFALLRSKLLCVMRGSRSIKTMDFALNEIEIAEKTSKPSV